MKFIYAIISGLLYAAAFPKWDLHFLIFIAFIPLLFAADKLVKEGKKGFWKSFTLFFVFGTAANTGLLYWIPEVMETYGNAHFALGVIALLLLSALLAVFPGLAGVLIVKELPKSYISAISIPAIWISKDYVLEWIMTGFPWCPAGYSQYSNLTFIQIAEFGGVHLLSFIIIAVNVLIFTDIRKRKITGTSIAAVTVVLVMFCGYFLQKRYEEDTFSTKAWKAAILQPNYSGDRRDTVRRFHLLMENSSRLADNGADFIVWPEYTVSIYPNQNRYFLDQFNKFAREKAPLIGGFTDFQGQGKIYNSVFLFNGADAEKYDKNHLVPFGEYVPLRWLFFFFQKITDEVGDFTPGTGTSNLNLFGHKVATPICYEIIFPTLVRNFVENGAELLVTCSNDAWYGISSAPGQLLAMSVLRSVENRRYNIRSVSTGISAFITPTGRIKESIPLNTSSSRISKIHFIKERTFFTSLGYRFPWFCAGIYLALLPFGRSRKKKKRKK